MPLQEIVNLEFECPLCKGKHSYAIEETYEVRRPVFGGPVEDERAVVILTCPVTHQEFRQEFAPEPQPNRKFIEAKVSSGKPRRHKAAPVNSEAAVSSKLTDATTSTEDSEMSSEYAAMLAGSLQTARDYCKNMVTTATGAIPVYFAVMKYLGLERFTNLYERFFGVLPPIFFFLAAGAFVLALHPNYTRLAPSDFEKYRDERITKMNRRMAIANVLFGIGVAASMIVWFTIAGPRP